MDYQISERITIAVLSGGKTHKKDCIVKSDGSYLEADNECRRIANTHFRGKIDNVTWWYTP